MEFSVSFQWCLLGYQTFSTDQSQKTLDFANLDTMISELFRVLHLQKGRSRPLQTSSRGKRPLTLFGAQDGLEKFSDSTPSFFPNATFGKHESSSPSAEKHPTLWTWTNETVAERGILPTKLQYLTWGKRAIGGQHSFESTAKVGLPSRNSPTPEHEMQEEAE